MEKIKVLIVEDNKILQSSLANYIRQSEECMLGEVFSSCEELLIFLVKNQEIDVVLMDINLPGINGIEGTKQINSLYQHINVIIVSVLDSSDSVFAALSAGATGYLTKNFQDNELINAIVDCCKGGAPMSAKIAKLVVNSFKKNQDTLLTERESEVLHLLSLGHSYHTISEHLFVSSATVKFHIKNIYFKLQVNSKTQALLEARKRNYI